MLGGGRPRAGATVDVRLSYDDYDPELVKREYNVQNIDSGDVLAFKGDLYSVTYESRDYCPEDLLLHCAPLPKPRERRAFLSIN